MIDRNRWQQYTFYEQMGNIASELSSAIRFKHNHEDEHMDAALCRLLEPLENTIGDPKNKNRLRELCRLKEILADWYCGTHEYSIDPESLKRYAMDFALLARKDR